MLKSMDVGTRVKSLYNEGVVKPNVTKYSAFPIRHVNHISKTVNTEKCLSEFFLYKLSTVGLHYNRAVFCLHR